MQVARLFYEKKLKSVNYSEWDQTHLKLIYTFLKKKGRRDDILDLYEYIRATNNQ